MPKTISSSLLILFLGLQVGINHQIAKAQTPTPVAPTTNPKTICPAQLGTAVDAIISRSEFSRARWGILVQNLGSTETLYNRDAQKYFIPASNTKVLTTAAALIQLGANYRIRTSVYRDRDGLRVVGRGDPSLTDAQLITLAKQLKQKGIKEIRQLIVDDSYFQGDIVNPSWQWEDLQSGDGIPINSLIVNQNSFSFIVSPQTSGKPLKLIWLNSDQKKQWQIINQSVTVEKNQPSFIKVTRDLQGSTLRIQGQLPEGSQSQFVNLPVFTPAEYFLQRFRRALAAEKITVRQASILDSSSENEIAELAVVQSPLLSELVMTANQNSNNFYTEALLRALAIKKPATKNQSTADAGIEVLKATLTQLGVEPTSYILADGSGLSRKNLITPQALVQTLQGMANSPQAKVFRASLPVAGVSGTLKNRLIDTSAAGIVQAKTGTLGGVVTLSGYVNAPNYNPVVFSMMVNQTEQPARVVRQAMDEILVMLAQLQRC
ncbi:D-alanyl-D-alanine carboxypeptidase/D-alanyl-D-alanine-endopeptidase [Chlorogloeopsis sp. ULAP01]|uniref:D-alanyl-D-alanine carboxypeptidase/D-alanyl-D-alanine endopeptidase n=1 Tax=Chlorogloeopsis sp. ULAP01 TaxID=3056483 RepID=UPI0025AA8A69|nr:D-alanyl-D-alanine carboxypeptidase/D-alanyl-D-alanine-endopeptidase [Chlorogloeopsis sp. ULAP01]MDM9385007.1 D-alanyl-D-alanine carboxypeptidase/D-alanyl-D-alanine-endopeptidase [Chlorogloeopsis sp. ULAP01]